MSVPLARIIEAFQMGDFGGADFETSAYVERDTGETFIDHDDALDRPEDLCDERQYVMLPDKRDLDLGSELAFDFAEQHLRPPDADRVFDFFRRRGANRNFKDLL